MLTTKKILICFSLVVLAVSCGNNRSTQLNKASSPNTQHTIYDNLLGNWQQAATITKAISTTGNTYDTTKLTSNGYFIFTSSGEYKFLLIGKDTSAGSLNGWSEDNKYLLPLKDSKSGNLYKFIVETNRNDTLVLTDTNYIFRYLFIKKHPAK